ncbi:mucin-1-like [Drosophila subpulchrella]|uniref:mucin-1-like n=1 Tax=Drosophila subpulchrella TaxID=1486046 RepID=UPI0018A13CA9|nr:mucin-1-like [Drosophila subpulchrella]
MFLPKFDGQGRVTPRDEAGYRRSSLARGRCFIAVGSRRDTGDSPHSHVASHEAVKRIPRPEQRPQSGPAAPNERPASGVSAPPAAPTCSSGAPNERLTERHQERQSAAPTERKTVPSTVPTAPTAVSTERHQEPQSAAPTAAPSRALSSANRAGYVVTSQATSATRSAQRAATAPSATSTAPPAAPSTGQRERQPQPHRSATAACQQYLPCAPGSAQRPVTTLGALTE